MFAGLQEPSCNGEPGCSGVAVFGCRDVLRAGVRGRGGTYREIALTIIGDERM